MCQYAAISRQNEADNFWIEKQRIIRKPFYEVIIFSIRFGEIMELYLLYSVLTNGQPHYEV